MKKLFLTLFSILFCTSLLSHEGPNNFDSKKNCRKKHSMLQGIAKLKGYSGGEIIKFNSYTGLDQRTVLTDGHLNNPIEITGYLQLPEGTNKVPIVIYTHSSGGPHDYIWDDFVYHAAQNLLKEGIGVMYIDNFCPRGASSVWRDQSKVPLINGAIDALMALKVLQSHPRSDGKFGTTGHLEVALILFSYRMLNSHQNFLMVQKVLMRFYRKQQNVEWLVFLQNQN